MKNLKNIINKFNQTKVLVIGDLILDQYIFGSVERISPEAPVPVVWAKRRSYVPGGAANVAYNIRALEGNVSLLGIIGKDLDGRILLSELKKRKMNTRSIFQDTQRCTTLKTRLIAGHQQVVRIDWEHTDYISKKINQKIVNFMQDNIKNFDAVIIEDYGKGVINATLLRELIDLAKKNRKIITVDPKEEHFQYYRQVTSITPNRRELENAIRNLKLKDTANRFKINSDRLFTNQDIDLAGKEIMSYLGLDSLLVTLGEQGMRLFESPNRITHIPTVAQEVFDVSGAGDTVIATYTLALASGARRIEAAHLANFAAGIVVGKLGTAVTNRKELIERLSKI